MRIEQLREELTAGPVEGVVARFWAEVALTGTPLIEPYDADHRLVTFLWRQEGPLDTVVVIGGPALWWEIPDNQLEHLPGTDIWFRSYVARADLRGRYVLSPNDSLKPLESAGTIAAVERSATFTRDPFNRHPFTLPAIPGDPAGPKPCPSFRRWTTWSRRACFRLWSLCSRTAWTLRPRLGNCLVMTGLWTSWPTTWSVGSRRAAHRSPAHGDCREELWRIGFRVRRPAPA